MNYLFHFFVRVRMSAGIKYKSIVTEQASKQQDRPSWQQQREKTGHGQAKPKNKLDHYLWRMYAYSFFVLAKCISWAQLDAMKMWV